MCVCVCFSFYPEVKYFVQCLKGSEGEGGDVWLRSGPPRRRGRVPLHLECSLSATVN